MKKMIMLVVLAMVPVLLMAGEEKKVENKELQMLQKKYEQDVRYAVNPITVRYMDSLEDLKKKLGGEGKLEEAMLVAKEIEKISEVWKTDKAETTVATTSKKLEIVKATWGSDKRLDDITTFMRKQVKDNKLQYTCDGAEWRMLGDPAPGVVKTVVVKYRYGIGDVQEKSVVLTVGGSNRIVIP